MCFFRETIKKLPTVKDGFEALSGSGVSVANVQWISKWPDEMEFLFSRGTSFSWQATVEVKEGNSNTQNVKISRSLKRMRGVSFITLCYLAYDKEETMLSNSQVAIGLNAFIQFKQISKKLKNFDDIYSYFWMEDTLLRICQLPWAIKNLKKRMEKSKKILSQKLQYSKNSDLTIASFSGCSIFEFVCSEKEGKEAKWMELKPSPFGLWLEKDDETYELRTNPKHVLVQLPPRSPLE